MRWSEVGKAHCTPSYVPKQHFSSVGGWKQYVCIHLLHTNSRQYTLMWASQGLLLHVIFLLTNNGICWPTKSLAKTWPPILKRLMSENLLYMYSISCSCEFTRVLALLMFSSVTISLWKPLETFFCTCNHLEDNALNVITVFLPKTYIYTTQKIGGRGSSLHIYTSTR